MNPSGSAPPEQEPRRRRALPLELDQLWRSERIAFSKAGCRRLGDEDPAGLAVGLQSARKVHGVTPEVVRELPPTDHAGDCRPRGDPDARLDRAPRRPTRLGQRLLRGERHLGGGLGAPATAMYASPTVLIFSSPKRSASASNRVNRSSRADTRTPGGVRAACS